MSAHDYGLLARLFSLELDPPTRALLESDGRFCAVLPASLQDARVEFTRLFTLSVYPYASVFLEPEAAMNGESTASVERFYEHVGFKVTQEWMVGAPDALGAELACLTWLSESGDKTAAQGFLRDYLLSWAPVCCLAIEHNAHLDFYRALAEVTVALLLGATDGLEEIQVRRNEWTEPEPEERDLRWVIDYMVAPARCGVFLSKEDLRAIAARVQIPISFGDRGLMLMSLLRGAGLHERIPETLASLQQIVQQWKAHYAAWVLDHPRSAALWRLWLGRTEATLMMLSEMSREAAGLRMGRG